MQIKSKKYQHIVLSLSLFFSMILNAPFSDFHLLSVKVLVLFVLHDKHKRFMKFKKKITRLSKFKYLYQNCM